jgi:hypothetical protein
VFLQSPLTYRGPPGSECLACSVSGHRSFSSPSIWSCPYSSYSEFVGLLCFFLPNLLLVTCGLGGKIQEGENSHLWNIPLQSSRNGQVLCDRICSHIWIESTHTFPRYLFIVGVFLLLFLVLAVLVFARQVLYHWSHTSGPFFAFYMYVCMYLIGFHAFCLGWPWATVLLPTPSQVAGMIGVHHHIQRTMVFSYPALSTLLEPVVFQFIEGRGSLKVFSYFSSCFPLLTTQWTKTSEVSCS